MVYLSKEGGEHVGAAEGEKPDEFLEQDEPEGERPEPREEETSSEQTSPHRTKDQTSQFQGRWPDEYETLPEMEFWDKDGVLPRFPEGGPS